MKTKMEWRYDGGDLKIRKSMRWYLTYGIDDSGTVYVPAAYSEENERNTALLASTDRQPTVFLEEHPFVPLKWIKDNYPKSLPMVEKVELAVFAADF